VTNGGFVLVKIRRAGRRAVAYGFILWWG